MAALVFRTLVSVVAALVGVLATYAVADGRGIGPWLLIFAVGLGVGFGTRGGWLAGLFGVIAAHVLVGYVKTMNGSEGGRDAIDFAGDGLLLGIVLFTPGYLFGAAARRRPADVTSDDGEEGAADEPWLSRRAMVVLACAILGVFGLLMGYIVVLLLTSGGDRTP
jgi:hypothetical protein